MKIKNINFKVYIYIIINIYTPKPNTLYPKSLTLSPKPYNLYIKKDKFLVCIYIYIINTYKINKIH